MFLFFCYFTLCTFSVQSEVLRVKSETHSEGVKGNCTEDKQGFIKVCQSLCMKLRKTK